MQVLGEQYLILLEQARRDHHDAMELEIEQFGFNRLTVSAALLQRWCFASSIHRAVAACTPMDQEQARDESVEVLGLRDALLTAGALADLLCHDPSHEARERLCLLGERHYDMVGTTLHRFINRIENRTAEISELFDFDLGPLPSYEQILEQANTALAERAVAAHLQTEQAEARAASLELEKEHYRRKALLDPLTGAYNRTFFMETLEREYQRCARYGEPVGMLFIDLDGFKATNDAHGHHVGDELLRRVARAAMNTLRDSDVLARYGGDEFVALLLRPKQDDIEWVGERVRRAIEAVTLIHNDQALKVTASIGCSFARPRRGASNCARLVIGADLAMYQAKNEGGNCTSHEPPPPSSTISPIE